MRTLEPANNAVMFVDLLGMGWLTTVRSNNCSENKIDESCYQEWSIKKSKDQTPQMLAARVLVQFRKNLNIIKEKHPIKIAQLSDGAFLWSDNLKGFIVACHDLMLKNIETGIFCRGGMAYGEVIASNDPLSIGDFILGDAVTKAVKVEGVGKGARIFMDESIIEQMNSKFNDILVNSQFDIISPITNQLTGDTFDEFRWYILKNLDMHLSSCNKLQKQKSIDEHKKNMEELQEQLSKYLANKKFQWNKATYEGEKHHKLTVNMINNVKFQCGNYISNIY